MSILKQPNHEFAGKRLKKSPSSNDENSLFTKIKIEKAIKMIEYLEAEILDLEKAFKSKLNHNVDGFNPLISYFVFDLLDYVRQHYKNYPFSKKIRNFEKKLSKIFEEEKLSNE